MGVLIGFSWLRMVQIILCEYGNKFPVSYKRQRISCSYERQCSEEGLCLETKIPRLVSI